MGCPRLHLELLLYMEPGVSLQDSGGESGPATYGVAPCDPAAGDGLEVVSRSSARPVLQREEPTMKYMIAVATVLVMTFASAEEYNIDGLIYNIEVKPETLGNYDRSEWPHWTRKYGGHCFTVRDKVLAEESLVPVTTSAKKSGRCRVNSGHWHDPYTGRNFNKVSEVDIDHMVPLHEAHKSGGYAWDREMRRAYANDLSYKDHLIAVEARENRIAKSDRDPADYLPREEFQCEYVQIWIKIKHKWKLSADQDEIDAINEVISSKCKE